MAFKLRSSGPFKMMGSSPAKHGKNPTGDKLHTKFQTETEHEEYQDKHPTKDLNKAEMKKAETDWLDEQRKPVDLTKTPVGPRTKKEKGRDPEKPFTQEELLKRVGGVRTKKSPAKHTSKWGAHTHARFDRNETHEHSARYPSTEKKKKKKNKKGTVVSRNIKKLGKWVSGIRIKGGRKRVGYGPKAW